MNQRNSVDANKFRSILNKFGKENHVNRDLVIDCVENSIVGIVNVEPQSIISDHMVANLKKVVDDVPKNKAVKNFRNYNFLDVVDFSNYLLTNYEEFLFLSCTHLTNMSPMCVNSKTNFYRNDASSYIKQKTPLICMEITVKETGGVRYNSQIREAKKNYEKSGKIVS